MSDGSNNLKQYKRRQYLLDPRFQLHFAFVLVLGVFIVSSLMNWALFGMLYDQARAGVLKNGMPGLSPRNLMFLPMYGVLLAGVMGAVFAVWSIFMTHRICGPVKVMTEDLEALAAGRFPRHRALRKNDEFKEMHAALGKAVDSVHVRMTHQRDCMEAIRAMAEDYASEDAATLKTALRQIAAKARANSEMLSSGLGGEGGASPAAGNKAPARSAESVVAV
jgi:methyl-accepting chemotaxis protein